MLLIFTLEQMYGIVDKQDIVGSEQVGRHTAGINKPGGLFLPSSGNIDVLR